MSGINFGLWYSFRNPEQWKISYEQLYEEHLHQIEWAETLGYNSVWLTEHHFCEDGHAPSIIPLAAAVAVKTKTIRVATGVLLLPLYNPVRVAEDAATIDILSKGRFELGVGIGYRPSEFKGLGVSIKDRASLTEEGLDIINRLLRCESVTFTGKHYKLVDVKISPTPVQKPSPPLWVGGFVPEAAKRAARFASGYIGFGDMKELADCFFEERARLGKTDKSLLAGGHFWLIVTKTPKQTFEEIGPHVLYQMQMYNLWLKDAGQQLFPDIKTLEDLKTLNLLQCLSPEEARDVVGTYIEKNRITHYYSWTVPPGYPTKKMDEHLAVFAEEVITHFD